MSICFVNIFTILWLLLSICFLMHARKSVDKTAIPRGTYRTPPCSCVIRTGLLMADPNAKYGLRDDAIVAVLYANIEA